MLSLYGGSTDEEGSFWQEKIRNLPVPKWVYRQDGHRKRALVCVVGEDPVHRYVEMCPVREARRSHNVQRETRKDKEAREIPMNGVVDALHGGLLRLFRPAEEISPEMRDPDHALKELEKINNGKYSVTCSKCHHCR